MKRVNAAYVIATVTKGDLPKKLPKDIDDSYFAKEESEEPAAGVGVCCNTCSAAQTEDTTAREMATWNGWAQSGRVLGGILCLDAKHRCITRAEAGVSRDSPLASTRPRVASTD